ncbi:hypothetical protein BDZ94DRAFT_1303167, partial [Collybia nuda]
MPKQNKRSQRAREREAAKQGEMTLAMRAYAEEISADLTYEDSASEDSEASPVIASTSSVTPLDDNTLGLDWTTNNITNARKRRREDADLFHDRHFGSSRMSKWREQERKTKKACAKYMQPSIASIFQIKPRRAEVTDPEVQVIDPPSTIHDVDMDDPDEIMELTGLYSCLDGPSLTLDEVGTTGMTNPVPPVEERAAPVAAVPTSDVGCESNATDDEGSVQGPDLEDIASLSQDVTVSLFLSLSYLILHYLTFGLSLSPISSLSPFH